MRRTRPLIRLPCLESFGSAANLLCTAAGSISTPSCSERLQTDESCPPSPRQRGVRRCYHTPYPDTCTAATGRLLNPLQANLGYYEGSVALQVRALVHRTSVGDPVFTLWQSYGVGGSPVRPFDPAHCGHVGRAGTMAVGHLHDHAVPRHRCNDPTLPSTIRP
jgi:hypothetical protein